MHGGNVKWDTFLSKTSKGRNHLRDRSADERTILKWFLKYSAQKRVLVNTVMNLRFHKSG
jgi:hypothetical protein